MTQVENCLNLNQFKKKFFLEIITRTVTIDKAPIGMSFLFNFRTYRIWAILVSDRVPEIGFLGKYFLPVKYGFVSQVEQGRYIILQFLA